MCDDDFNVREDIVDDVDRCLDHVRAVEIGTATASYSIDDSENTNYKLQVDISIKREPKDPTNAVKS